MQQFIGSLSTLEIAIVGLLLTALLYSLGSRRIWILFLLVLLPGAFAVLLLLIGANYLEIGWPVLLGIAIAILLLWDFLGQKYPLTADLRNEETIKHIERDNEILARFKDSSFKTEAMQAWIEDGIPEKVPARISKLKELANRIVHYAKYGTPMNWGRWVYNYLLWQYGRGGNRQDVFPRIDDFSTLICAYRNKSSESICDIIKILITETKPIRGFMPSYLASIVIYFSIVYVLSDNFSDGSLIYTSKSIALLVMLGALYQLLLRRYAFNGTAHFNLLKVLLGDLQERGEIIGIRWNENSDSRETKEPSALEVKYFSRANSKICPMFTLKSEGVDYFVIEPEIGFRTFHKLLPILRDRNRLSAWMAKAASEATGTLTTQEY